MKVVGRVIGLMVLLGAAVPLPGVGAQEVVRPEISLTLTETLNRIVSTPSARDDLREIPPPRNDKLSDAIRVTVIMGSPECLPGEDGWVAQRPVRRTGRPR
jgi:hypothetical protein